MYKKLEQYKIQVQNIEQRIKFNNDNKNKLLKDKNKYCPICFEENLNNFGITRCGHKFCISCIKRCVANQMKCPICRSVLYYEDVCFFNDTEYKFVSIDKKKSSDIIEHNMFDDRDLLYIPGNSHIFVKNPYTNSIILSIRKINGKGLHRV